MVVVSGISLVIGALAAFLKDFKIFAGLTLVLAGERNLPCE